MSVPSRTSFPVRDAQPAAAGQSPDSKSPATGPAADPEIPSEVIAAGADVMRGQKGRPQGTALQDWLEAEAELERTRGLAQRLAETNARLQEALAESRRREGELRRAEERYRGIFDHATEGIFQTSPD